MIRLGQKSPSIGIAIKRKLAQCFMLQALLDLWQKLTDMTKMSLANTPGILSSQASIPTAGIHVLLLSDASRESHSLDSTVFRLKATTGFHVS